jgi:hypothetical protein
MNNLHLTINTHPESFISSSFWTLYGHKEPERIAVRFNNKEYVTVLDVEPYFEVWSLDADGELNEIEQTFKSPEGLQNVFYKG